MKTTVSVDDIDKFGEKEISKKKTLAKNTWYDWQHRLIYYIPKSSKKSVNFATDKTNTNKNYIKQTRFKIVYSGGKKPRKLKTQKQYEDKKIKDKKNFFRLRN